MVTNKGPNILIAKVYRQYGSGMFLNLAVQQVQAMCPDVHVYGTVITRVTLPVQIGNISLMSSCYNKTLSPPVLMVTETVSRRVVCGVIFKDSWPKEKIYYFV